MGIDRHADRAEGGGRIGGGGAADAGGAQAGGDSDHRYPAIFLGNAAGQAAAQAGIRVADLVDPRLASVAEMLVAVGGQPGQLGGMEVIEVERRNGGLPCEVMSSIRNMEMLRFCDSPSGEL